MAKGITRVKGEELKVIGSRSTMEIVSYHFLQVDKYRNTSLPSDKKSLAKDIYNLFLSPSAAHQLNLTPYWYDKVVCSPRDRDHFGNLKFPVIFHFFLSSPYFKNSEDFNEAWLEPVQRDIINLLYKDVWHAYTKECEEYSQFLTNQCE